MKTLIIFAMTISLMACSTHSVQDDSKKNAQTSSSAAANLQVEPKVGMTFDSVVASADRLTATKMIWKDNKHTKGDSFTVDLAKFKAAVGTSTKATNTIPRCLPTYTFIFSKGEDEVASFGGVCSETSPVLLVLDTISFQSANSDMLHDLLK